MPSMLITGGAGYIGSTILDEALKDPKFNDWTFTILDNLHRRGTMSNIKKFQSSRVKYINGDILDNETLHKSTKNIDTIVHLAAVTGVIRCRDAPQLAVNTNIYGTYSLIQAAKQADVQKLILSSTIAVYGNIKTQVLTEDTPPNPINLYGITKVAGEHLVKYASQSLDLGGTVLRFSNIYGLGTFAYWSTIVARLVKLAIHGDTLTIHGSGNQSRDFLHVRDAAQAILNTVQTSSKITKGQTYQIGGNRSTSIKALSDIIAKRVKQRKNQQVKVEYLKSRESEPISPTFEYSIKRARKHLKYHPKFRLEDGINELMDEAEKLP